MFILKKGHQPGVYVPLRALFLVILWKDRIKVSQHMRALHFLSSIRPSVNRYCIGDC